MNYQELLKQGIQRVQDLTNQYEQFLKQKDHGMAAITRGELSAARAWLAGAVAAGEAKREDKNASTN